MKKLLFGILSIGIVINPYAVYGAELVIEGNGDGSSSEVSVEIEQNTEVTQENNAEVNNDVQVDANTGDNTANENTGAEVGIETGNIDAEVNINNEGINQSYVDAGCCNGGETNITVSGNGSDSENVVVYSNTSTTNVTVVNNASITNNITGIANTGQNVANNNTGSVSIVTGNITAKDNIVNKGINVYRVEAKSAGGSITVKVKDNGDNSDNSVTIINDDSVNVSIQNSANIVNETNWDLNTGRNTANGNSGDVKIATGDIYYESNISNEDINVGWVDVDCCGTDPGGPVDPGKPVDPNPPVSPPGGGSNGGSSGGDGGSSGGSSDGSNGAMLPVTGPSNLIMLGIVLSIMFFLGWYLRLRSGNSPNFA